MLRLVAIAMCAFAVCGCGNNVNPLQVANAIEERNVDAEDAMECLIEVPSVRTYSSLNELHVDLAFDKTCIESIDVFTDEDDTE